MTSALADFARLRQLLADESEHGRRALAGLRHAPTTITQAELMKNVLADLLSAPGPPPYRSAHWPTLLL
jgi:hypothetical protein